MANLTIDEAVREATACFALAKKMARAMKDRHPYDADDIDSDIYTMLVGFLQNYDPERSPLRVPNYIRNFFRYRLIDYENRTYFKPVRSVSLDQIEEEIGEPIVVSKEKDPAEQFLEKESFEERLSKLPRTYARVMRLHYGKGMDSEVVAKKLNRSINWTERIIRNSMRILRNQTTRKFPIHWHTVIIDKRKDSIYNWSKDPRCVVSYKTLLSRINDQKMEPFKAMTTPIQNNIYRHRSLLTAFGETKTHRHWMRDPRCQVVMEVLHQRLERGMSPEDALTLTKRSSNGGDIKLYEAFGENKTLAGWGKDPRCLVKYPTLYARMHRDGMSFHDALTMPKRPRNRFAKGHNLRRKTTQPKGSGGKFIPKKVDIVSSA